MNIDTEKEAEEYFEHNPKEKKVYFVMLTDYDMEMLGIETDSLDLLATVNNSFFDEWKKINNR